MPVVTEEGVSDRKLAELADMIKDLGLNDMLRLLGEMFDEDFRRIRRWR